MKKVFVLILTALLLVLSLRPADAQEHRLAVNELVYLLEHQVPPPRIAALVEELGVNFELTRTVRTRLQKAGADNAVLVAIERAAEVFARERLQQEQRAVQTARERRYRERDRQEKASSAEKPLEPQLATLFARASRQEQAQRFTTPTGDNALETYRAILQHAPGHPEALAGIRRLRNRYERWATAAEDRGAWSEAQAYYEKALTVAPGDAALRAALEKIKRHQQAKKRSPLPANRPPQITQYFPSEETVTMLLGERRNFLAAAIDPDGDELSYVWTVNGQLMTQGKRFTFVASQPGRHRLGLTVTDRKGLEAESHWAVQVEERAAELQLVIFTPPQTSLALLPHQSRLFAVQAELPGRAGSPLQYRWAVNDQFVSTQEVFEFKEPPIGSHTITVTVTASSGTRLQHGWAVEVAGVEDDDDIPPLWWPRTRVFGMEVTVSPEDQQQITITGNVRNQDEKRRADNIIVEVNGFDGSGQTRLRAYAVPTPQPLPPGGIGTFRITISSGLQLGFRPAILRKKEEDEDYQIVKSRLVRRAEGAQRAGKWKEAEALIKTAIKVYPPDERALKAQLREIQKRTQQRPISTSLGSVVGIPTIG